MAFYEGLGKKIQQTGQGAVDKTKKSAETVKLNSAISNLEREIEKEYTELGRKYYQKHAKDEQDPDLVPHFKKISDNLEEIQKNRDQIDEIKGMQKCPNCGRSISGTMVFCKYCGARLVPEYTESEESSAEESAAAGATFCPGCGAKLDPGAAFCASCGMKIE